MNELITLTTQEQLLTDRGMAGLIQHYRFTETYDEIYNATRWKGVPDSEVKITTKQAPNTDWKGIAYENKTFQKENTKHTTHYAYKPDIAREIIDQHNKSGRPELTNKMLRKKLTEQFESWRDKELSIIIRYAL